MEEAEIERAKRKPTGSLDAYDYYLRGLAILDRTLSREATNDALGLFKEAIARDPEFALAYARAAWMADHAAEVGEAILFAQKAVEFGRDDALALSYGGLVLGYVAGNLDQCASCIDQALVLNPNLAAAWGFSSWAKTCLGEPDAAIEHAAFAMRLSPLDPRLFAWQFTAGLAHFCAGHYEDALAWAEKSLQRQPKYGSAMRLAAASHALTGVLWRHGN